MTQFSIFPLRNLRVTQGEQSAYSHGGSRAQDHGGAAPGTDDCIYAPFDGTVARVRTDSSHETYFVSDAPVTCPDGYVGVLTLTLMHDNVLDVHEGQRLRQGEKLGDEGGFGNGRKDTFAHHAHIEASRGKQTRQVRNAHGVWCTPNQVALYNAFFLSSDTRILNDGGYTWRRLPTASAAKHTHRVATLGGALHVRTAPDTRYGIVTKLPNGAAVAVTERDGAWGYIGTGWVSLAYLHPES